MTDAIRRYVAMPAYQQAFVADFLVTQVSEEVLEQALKYGQIVEDRNNGRLFGSTATAND